MIIKWVIWIVLPVKISHQLYPYKVDSTEDLAKLYLKHLIITSPGTPNLWLQKHESPSFPSRMFPRPWPHKPIPGASPSTHKLRPSCHLRHHRRRKSPPDQHNHPASLTHLRPFLRRLRPRNPQPQPHLPPIILRLQAPRLPIPNKTHHFPQRTKPLESLHLCHLFPLVPLGGGCRRRSPHPIGASLRPTSNTLSSVLPLLPWLWRYHSE